MPTTPTLAERQPLPAAFSSSTAISEVAAASSALSWKQAALLVLVEAGEPLRAQQIVSRITELGLVTRTHTRTPAQSINRDLHNAVRRGEEGIASGPEPGQFYAPSIHRPSPARVTERVRRTVVPRGPRLPIEPLQAAVEAIGGVGTAGFGGSADREQQRLGRTYHRSVKRGWIDLYDADTIAIRHLGMHPCMLWGSGWWDTLAEADLKAGCAAPGPWAP